jgi:hypothetical protein
MDATKRSEPATFVHRSAGVRVSATFELDKDGKKKRGAEVIATALDGQWKDSDPVRRFDYFDFEALYLPVK